MTGTAAASMITVAPEVHDALRSGRPVVALETAVLTHGLPRTPMACPCRLAAWDASLPANLALSLQEAVKAGSITGPPPIV